MTSRRRTQDERGAVAIVVAASVGLLVAILAFAIDLGMTRSDRANAQGVADNAALSAVYAYCESLKTKTVVQAQADGTAAANSVATANGYTATVTPQGAGSLEGWRVRITSSTDGSFMPAVVNKAKITSELTAVAAASCGTATSYPALFAIGSCPDALLLNGKSIVVGDIHSNGVGKINGEYTITGNVSSVGSLIKDPPPQVTIIGSASGSQPPKADPVAENIANWRPGSARALALENANPLLDRYHDFSNTLINQSHVTKPGVYYTKQGVNFTQDNKLLVNATFVIDRTSGEKVFEVTKKNITHTHYVDPVWNPKNIAVITNTSPGCGKEAILINDEGYNHTGVLYAPNSYILVNAKASSKTVGSMIGGQVRINGDGWKVASVQGLNPGTSGMTLVR